MSLTLEDCVESLIRNRNTVEQCYSNILTWPEETQEEGVKILLAKLKEGRFDKAIRFRNTVFINPKNPSKTPFVPKKKPNFLQKLFNKK